MDPRVEAVRLALAASDDQTTLHEHPVSAIFTDDDRILLDALTERYQESGGTRLSAHPSELPSPVRVVFDHIGLGPGQNLRLNKHVVIPPDVYAALYTHLLDTYANAKCRSYRAMATLTRSHLDHVRRQVRVLGLNR